MSFAQLVADSKAVYAAAVDRAKDMEPEARAKYLDEIAAYLGEQFVKQLVAEAIDSSPPTDVLVRVVDVERVIGDPNLKFDSKKAIQEFKQHPGAILPNGELQVLARQRELGFTLDAVVGVIKELCAHSGIPAPADL